MRKNTRINRIQAGKHILMLCLCTLAYIMSSCASTARTEFDNSSDPQVKLFQIRQLMGNLRYTIAQELLEEMKVEYADDPSLQMEIGYELGFVLLQRRRYQESATVFNEVLRMYEESEEKNQLVDWPYYLSRKILTEYVEPKL